MEPWQIYKTVKGGISGNSRNSTVGCTKSKNHTNTPLYITIPLSDSESNLSLSLSLSLCNAPNGQQQRRTTEQLNKIIDHGVEADASTSPNRRNTHPQAPPEAMAEGGRTHQQPHSVERDPNRFNPQRDHHPLHLLLLVLTSTCSLQCPKYIRPTNLAFFLRCFRNWSRIGFESGQKGVTQFLTLLLSVGGDAVALSPCGG